jgi:nucleoside 2-deoxyribosyltransferase
VKIYIAGHDQEEAKSLAAVCVSAGHEVTSRWLGKEFKGTDKHTVEERQAIAVEDEQDVRSADTLVLISCERRVPGGKFIEVGIALGERKPVYVLGHRENMLMWHPSITLVESVDALMAVLT